MASSTSASLREAASVEEPVVKAVLLNEETEMVIAPNEVSTGLTAIVQANTFADDMAAKRKTHEIVFDKPFVELKSTG